MRFIVAAASLFALASLPTRAAAVTVSIAPAVSMTDAAVDIRVSAPPGDSVRVEVAAQKFGLTFRSAAAYRSPKSGIIDIATQAPISGSYAGVDEMGLFWTAVPDNTPP